MEFAEEIKRIKFVPYRKIYQVVLSKGIFTDEVLLEIAKISAAPCYTLHKITGKEPCLELLSYYGNRHQVAKLLWRSSFRHRKMLAASYPNMLNALTVIESKS